MSEKTDALNRLAEAIENLSSSDHQSSFNDGAKGGLADLRELFEINYYLREEVTPHMRKKNDTDLLKVACDVWATAVENKALAANLKTKQGLVKFEADLDRIYEVLRRFV